MKGFKKIGFFTAFIVPALAVSGYYAGGLWNYLAPAFAFVILPLIDHVTGLDTTNVKKDEIKQVSEDRYYRFVTFIWTYLQMAFVLWGCYAITQKPLHGAVEWIGFTVSFALVTGGIGITVAHELGHKNSSAERLYSKMLLMNVCYMHFYVEHNRGHHITVGTPEDPATAKRNQDFYSFWFSSVFGGYAHAWKLEIERLKKKGLPALHWKNKMIWFTLAPPMFCASVTGVLFVVNGNLDWEVPLFFAAQSIAAFTLLELVNYVEHYGIVRKELLPGKYEKVNPLHSWNASHLVSNLFLFQLQRHSDHHVYASKRYQVLDHHDESPQLPFGYPTMILIALVPPFWFSLMNHRLDVWAAKTFQLSPQTLSQPFG